MPTIVKHFKADAVKPDENVIADVAHELVRGNVGIIPTSSLYGLATNAFDRKAVNRIFSIKKRSPENPLLVLIGRIEQAEELVSTISPLARRLMARFWPGRVTFLFRARPGLPRGIVGPDDKVGIRMAAHPVTAALVKQLEVPITGTSANLSGRPACHRMEGVDPAILNQVDLTLNAGELLGGIGSSIVDLTLSTPQMLRRGTLDEKKFQEVLLKIL